MPATVHAFDPLALIQKDRKLWFAIMDSRHPDARRFVRWLFHEVIPAFDPLGLRRNPARSEVVVDAASGEEIRVMDAAETAARLAQLDPVTPPPYEMARLHADFERLMRRAVEAVLNNRPGEQLSLPL